MARIQSSEDSTELVIDPISKAARAALYTSGGKALGVSEMDQPTMGVAGLVAFGLNDEMVLPTRMDRLGSIGIASHNVLLTESFEGTTVNPARFLVTATTMAATQANASGLVVNSGNITTLNTGYLIQTAKRFLKSQRAPLQAKFRARVGGVNNSVIELGFGDASSFNGANTTGAYWQVTTNGVVQPVLTYNGVDQTGSNIRELLDYSKFYTWDVFLDDDEATFVVQDTSTGLVLSRQSLRLGQSGQRLWSASALPAMARLYNSSTAPASAPQLIVTDLYVLDLDINRNKAWPHTAAAMERGAHANPHTGAQAAAWANSAEPASATLSNTAAGYTTLGGKFQFAAVAGAATDYALFAYTVPVPANFNLTGIDIEAWNTGAAVATTPTLLTWAVAVGSTAVSLATATALRVGVGAQSFPVGAAIGAKAERISKSFQTPLHCPSGRFVHVILRMPVGTATASQIIAGMVNIEGYFD